MTRKAVDGQLPNGVGLRLVVATILRQEGSTGVQTHFQQFRRYLEVRGRELEIVTPFSWARRLTVPVFGVRLILERFSGAASVVWYRHWHEAFVRNALRSELAKTGRCVVYAQCPLSARAALRVRQGRHQKVVMAVHFRTSQADEWVNMDQIQRNGRVFRSIRRDERDVIPQVDGMVFVSRWARSALVEWFPEAATVPFAVIENFVEPHANRPSSEPIGDLVTIGHLEPVKNHRFMLKVLAEANKAGRRFTLDVFGDGPLEQELRQQVTSLGLEGQVRFRGYRKDVRAFLPGYRAYVHSSYSESSSLAIIEAMDAGLPIVAGRIGPIPELVDEDVEGRFWSLDDPWAAASTLINFLDSESMRQRAATAANERFRRDFDASVLGPRLLSFLEQPRSTALEGAGSGVERADAAGRR
jgi:glycosyltransferase involved in cell wall biosynthesis